MPETLTATPIESSSDTSLFIPSTGPEAAPPLYLATIFTLALIGGVAFAGTPGTYPGPLEYPGADVLPGQGSDLVATTSAPLTLIGVPA